MNKMFVDVVVRIFWVCLQLGVILGVYLLCEPYFTSLKGLLVFLLALAGGLSVLNKIKTTNWRLLWSEWALFRRVFVRLLAIYLLIIACIVAFAFEQIADINQAFIWAAVPIAVFANIYRFIALGALIPVIPSISMLRNIEKSLAVKMPKKLRAWLRVEKLENAIKVRIAELKEPEAQKLRAEIEAMQEKLRELES